MSRNSLFILTCRLKSKPKNLLDELLLPEANFLDSVINSLDQTPDVDKVAISVLLKLVPMDGLRNLNDQPRLEISPVSDDSARTGIPRASLSDLPVLSPTSKKPRRRKLLDLLLPSTPSPSSLEMVPNPRPLLLLLNDRSSNSNLEQNLSMEKKARTRRRRKVLEKPRRTRTMVLSTPTLLR